MSESNKIKSIDEVNSKKFICVDKETIDAVTNNKNTLGCYFKYIENEKLVKVIFLDRGRFLDTEMIMVLIEQTT
jgi:thymidine kinase